MISLTDWEHLSRKKKAFLGVLNFTLKVKGKCKQLMLSIQFNRANITELLILLLIVTYCRHRRIHKL